MGSPDLEHRRQLNGMGVGISNLPKIIVVVALLPQTAYMSNILMLESTRPISESVGLILESLRQAGTRRMGLASNARSQPKIAVLSSPSRDEDVDIVIHALSMGVLHKTVPMTVGLCLGVTAMIEESIPWTIVNEARNGQE
jgi:2-methylaconitate cis-trans-isomerase PrpF